MINGMLDIIFPQSRCSICRKRGNYSLRQPWCSQCQQEMKELAQSGKVCAVCGRYISDGKRCSDCRWHHPEFHIARGVGPYERSYRLTIKIYKFMGRRKLAWPMGRMMAEKIKAEPGFWPIDLLIAVPISSNGLEERGFNQTELLARQISRRLKVPFRNGSLRRVLERPSQRELTREEREHNLRCAFVVDQPKQIANKNIVLVDDVYTTGSTARECARVLLAAGAKRVSIITWATGRAF